MDNMTHMQTLLYLTCTYTVPLHYLDWYLKIILCSRNIPKTITRGNVLRIKYMY